MLLLCSCLSTKNVNRNVIWKKSHLINMKLLGNVSFRTFPTIKTLTQLELLSHSGLLRAAQVFYSHFIATMLVDHVSRSKILRDG